MLAATLCALCLAPSPGLAGWAPDVAAAARYAERRPGVVSFAVRTSDGRRWGRRAARGVPSASVLKAMLLVAYLRRPEVRDRALRPEDRALLAPMVRRSDNATASRIVVLLGVRGLRRFARRVGMRRFVPVLNPWGHSRIDAAEQARFFLAIDRHAPRRHRAYAMRLLATIVPAQRWGVGRVRPRGWSLFFKGGWGSGTGAVDHQIALLERDGERVALAITTTANGSHAAGKRTLRGVARRLLRGLRG